MHVDGVRHNLDALEALFEQSEAVAAAVCLLWQDQTRIHVFVSLSPHTASRSEDELVGALSEHAREVVNGLLPFDIHILSEDPATQNGGNFGTMPLTATGKNLFSASCSPARPPSLSLSAHPVSAPDRQEGPEAVAEPPTAA